ncbi:MAG TPA: hemolysin family protein [Actinomycetota bacterium]|nr:hemolysin family protein [Actinomycetota bacterium]
MAVAVAFSASAWVNALSHLSHARARRLAEQDPRRGELLVRLAANPRPYLASALLVMLLARVTATVLVADVLLREGVPAAAAVAIAVMTFVAFQFAEIAPRAWVLERPDQVSLLSARPVWFLGSVLRPLVAALIGINRLFLLVLPGRGVPRGPVASEEEIMSMLEVAESEDVIETQERQMISSIFEFGDTVVREVMVPRPDMVCVQAEAELALVLDLMLDQGFTRVPVIGADIDDLVGVAHARDVMRRLRANGGDQRHAPRRIGEVVREAYFVPESKKVAELLGELQASKTHMAIVVDEYGGTAGLVTMEDLLEEIVGEIADEFDSDEPPVVRVDDDTYRVIARLGVDELSELVGADLPDAEWDSVGGLVAGTLGRVPTQGDEIHLEGVDLQVDRMNGRRVASILVRRHREHTKDNGKEPEANTPGDPPE